MTDANNIILCGMPRIGKSTLGPLLAKQLKKPFFDTDRLLEGVHEKFKQDSLTSKDIFLDFGDKYFRSLEQNVLFSLQYLKNSVIAVGGGIVVNPENLVFIKKLGQVIYLKGELEILMKRMEQGGMPSFIDQNHPIASINALIQDRKHLYEKIADVTIDVGASSPDEIVEKILPQLLKSKGGTAPL